ncbi:MAG TPA: response regulator [Candidatus Limnocylindrales bacterium]
MQAPAALRRWLSASPDRDDVDGRQTVLLQRILVTIVLALLLSGALTLVVPGLGSPALALRALILLEPLFLIPLWLLRSGYFNLAATATVGVFEFVILIAVAAAGPSAPATGAAFAIPMTIAALVLRRPGLLAVTLITIAGIVGSTWLPDRPPIAAGPLLNLVISLAVLGLILDRFAVSMRDALSREIDHHHELELAQAELVQQAAALKATNEQLTREMQERALAEDARRAIEAKVLEVQKLESLGVLAGGIAHDFNNLLVAIMGNAGLALLDLPEDSPARASIIDVEVASRRAGELARQMLAYSGRSRFVIEPIELSELVRELLTLLQVSIGKRVILRLNLSPSPVVVDADAAQLRQVVMNLVINAADAIGDRSGNVTIRVDQMIADADELTRAHPGAGLGPGSYALLEVVDTGTGMDRVTQDRIFDPFFTTKFTGRGLGLAAVLGIVRGHGGALSVNSELGKGSTFRIVLPLSASSPAAGRSHDREWRGSGTVLVVDDDPMVRTVARRLLESFGLTVRVAAGGPEAIALVSAAPASVDAVLLDMTMPELSGPEVFSELRTIRADLPVVLMSGYHEDELDPGIGASISGFVQKPFTPADLARCMRVALEGRPSETGTAAGRPAEPSNTTPIGRDGV